MLSNRELYETDEVVAKYTARLTRNRTLNIAEKRFIDEYSIHGKRILVLGSGAGRVPANLLLFENTVVGVELSERLLEKALEIFPPDAFPRLRFLQGDAAGFPGIADNSFDVVWFPQNGLDYLPTVEDRHRALAEMVRVCRPGGLVAFSSLNLVAYCISYKLPWKQKAIRNLFKRQIFRKEYVVGGGFRYMARPSFLVAETVERFGLTFRGFTADVRNSLDHRLAKHLRLATPVFPWLHYVFGVPGADPGEREGGA